MPENTEPGMPYRYHFIRVHGQEIHFLRENRSRETRVVFVHGNGASSIMWRRILPLLENHISFVAPDLAGFGRSGTPDCEYGFYDEWRYFEGFMAELIAKKEKIWLVGHEWGGLLAMHWAALHPDQVEGIALMETFPRPLVWQDLEENDADLIKAFRTPDVGWGMMVVRNMYLEEMLPNQILRTLDADELEAWQNPLGDEWARKPLWAFMQDVPVEGEPEDICRLVQRAGAALKKADWKKLLITAEPGFFVTSPVVDWCRQNIRGIRIESAGEGRHWFTEDQPETTAAILNDWLGSK